MKKILFAISILAFFTTNANAQISVNPSGKVGIAMLSPTDTTSTFAVKGGASGFEASVWGTQRGIYGEARGHYQNWVYGVYGKTNSNTGNYFCGVSGIAYLPSPQLTGRTYGVYGIAGNASNGWNFGVYGQLNGTNNGAGVYGTATNGENGTQVDGRYAGYFNGATKVKGDLTVTGSISGVFLNQAPNANSISNISEEYEKASITDKLSKLSATQYYTETPTKQTEIKDNPSDTICTTAPFNEIEMLSAERMHYGLDIEQLKGTFPELVYEQKDGKIGINYMELIPVLVQAINNLSTEVKILKAGASYSGLERSASNTTSIMLSTDGKVIGTKRTISK